MKDIDKYTDQVVSEIKAGAGTFRHDNLTNSKCPRCGKRMLAVKGKNSEMLGLSGQRVRIPRNSITDNECEMSCVSQEDAAERKRGWTDFCVCLQDIRRS